MAPDPNLIQQLAAELHHAASVRRAVAPLTSRHPALTLGDAYAIQQAVVAHHAAAGHRPVGRKIGVTSRAVMQMLGVDQPDFGQLFDDMVLGDGSATPAERFIAPRAEGEIAFVMGRDLQGPGVTAADVLRATEAVMACIEICDSRIQDWKIGIVDTVADNASCGALVLASGWADPRGVDLLTCGMVLEKNGAVAVTGAGAATMNSPLNAVVWLANTLGRLGLGLRAGDVVLSGALAAMVPVARGDHVRVSIGGLGSCAVRFD